MVIMGVAWFVWEFKEKGTGKLYFVGFSTILLFTNHEDEEQSPPAARLTPKRPGVVSNPDLNTAAIHLGPWKK
jgi:hypothetical protein